MSELMRDLASLERLEKALEKALDELTYSENQVSLAHERARPALKHRAGATCQKFSPSIISTKPTPGISSFLPHGILR